MSKQAGNVCIIMLGILLLGSGAVRAQQIRSGLATDSVVVPQPGFKSRAVAPLAFYLPETKFGGGVVGFNYFKASRTDTMSRISMVRLLFLYTQTRQITANLSTDLYLHENKLWLNGGVAFYRLPYLFYGIGNEAQKSAEEEFTVQFPRLRLNSMWRFLPHVYAGLGLLYEKDRLVKTEAGKQLAQGSISGSRGGRLLGAGALFTYDSRDNNLSATRGSFADLNLFGFGKATRSDYKYRLLEIDLRRYQQLRPRHVLAAQAFFTDINGSPPFRRLALLGGSGIMRGYYTGRYRDKVLLAAQAEYRFPLFTFHFPLYLPVGAVVFAGAGDVAPDANHLDLFEFKPTYGGGLRFLLDPAKRLTVRFDAAFGYQTRGFYFSVGEAF